MAIDLTLNASPILAELARRTHLSLGESHNAVTRLGSAGLLVPAERRIAPEVLLPFLVHGVPHAYPPMLGAETLGERTAFLPSSGESTPADTNVEHVWPAASGKWRGQALIPLHPRAVQLVERNAPLAAVLAVVDLLRVGGARERAAAEEEIERLLAPRPA